MSIRILHLWFIAGGAAALETLTRLASSTSAPEWVMTGLVAVVLFCALVTVGTWIRVKA